MNPNPSVKPTRPRVGLWLGLLLLFAPVFYFLLWFKPYSPVARIGWGLWLGLIVFVKVTGLSEPVIEIRAPPPGSEPAGEAGEQPPGWRGTFIQQDQAPPSLDAYLGRLDEGRVGMEIRSFEEQGDALRLVLAVREADREREQALARAAVSSAYSLFYGRDYRALTLDFTLEGRTVRMRIARAPFNAFFGLSEAEMEALAGDRRAFDDSPVARLDNAGQRAFFLRFAE
jgi:hypothetical protein